MSNKILHEKGGIFPMKLKSTIAAVLFCAVFFCGCNDPYRVFSPDTEQTALVLPGKESAAAMAEEAPATDAESGQEETVYYVSGSELYHTRRDCSFLKKSEAVQSGTLRRAQLAGAKRKCSRCP